MRLASAEKYLAEPLLPTPYIVRQTLRRDPVRPFWERIAAFFAAVFAALLVAVITLPASAQSASWYAVRDYPAVIVAGPFEYSACLQYVVRAGYGMRCELR